MQAPVQFENVFAELKKILARYSSRLVCDRDDDHGYLLNTAYVMKNKKPLFFASVIINKNYVSYHLMPVYVYPELLEQLSVPLRQRMQGKSCFNFKVTDKKLFKELQDLTARGFERYQIDGYVDADTQ
ncbi:MAG: hypothetical protein HKN70_09195 [Gammaproteobacteria bacterium]|nr:hypothetical protein [Gammaproteobacteria bacterium]